MIKITKKQLKKIEDSVYAFCENEHIHKTIPNRIIRLLKKGEAHKLGQYDSFVLVDAIGCNDLDLDLSDCEKVYQIIWAQWYGIVKSINKDYRV